MSLAATGTAPLCARKRAACLPTAPKPCTATRSLEIETNELARHIDCGGETEAGGADLIERNAADRARQSDGAPRLVLDPRHAELVGAHVRASHVVGDIADRAGEGADDSLPLIDRHARVAEDYSLGAPVRQAGGGVLPRHGACQTEALLERDVGRHAHASDCRPAGGVVDDENGFEPQRRPMDMNDARGAPGVRETKRILHQVLPVSGLCSRSWITARKKRAASPPEIAR